MVGEAVAVAVADGHGSSLHADIGARFAICAALSVFTRFAHDNGGESADLRAIDHANHPLRVRIVREWRELVRADARRKGRPVGGNGIYRDYGSTILGAVASPKFLLVGQLGDGDMLLVDVNGKIRTPLSSDTAQVGDETESLCLPGAEYAFGIKVLRPPQDEALLLIATDGYSKSYEFRSDFEKIGPDYLDRIRYDGIDKIANRLRGYLREITDRGSGDDIAVAMFYWPPSGRGIGDEVQARSERSTDSKSVASRLCRLWRRHLKQRATTGKVEDVTMSKPELRKTADGARLPVEEKLGEGNQGEVWRATDGGAPVAVKIYHRHSASEEQKKSLERLVERRSPAPQFLWPSAMIDNISSGTYGYIMPLREDRFRPFEDYMARRIGPSMRALLTAGAQLARGFQRLHAEGLCYRDISFANIFLDPETGDVSICDNDNVDMSGAAPGGVLGTQRFMAPEVVRGEAPPSADTDRYSLAVLLFYILYGGHPLDGRREAQIRCLDTPAMEQLYGHRPLYIWDADDRSNRPVPGFHDNPLAFKNIWPDPLSRLFLESFTQGLRYPKKRIRESEWRMVLLRSIDGICLCGCGAENFHAAAAPPGAGERGCWKCSRKLALPPRIEFEDGDVLLTPNTRLFGRHVDSGDPDDAIAEIVRHPQLHDLFGLKNLSGEAWSLTGPDGPTVEVPPGKSAPIMDGNRINFGRRTGTVRAR